jgi:hypothetical protein
VKVYSSPEFFEDVRVLDTNEQYEVMHAYEMAQVNSKSQLLSSGALQPVCVDNEGMYVLHAGDKDIYCVTGAQDEADENELVFVRLSGGGDGW